jgi:SAM-dependent methyltransferase
MENQQNKYKFGYEKQAAYYDAIYEAQGKDYRKEANQIHEIITRHKKSPSSKLLDVGSGTGGHFPYLSERYVVQGLDLDGAMLEVARKRFPDGTFHQGDMVDFHLDQKFDAITCLFSAIGYTRSLENMQAAVRNMSRHLVEGGVLIIEPWYAPNEFAEGPPHATFVDRPDLKIARVNFGEIEGDVSILLFHFLVASEGEVEYFTERHELGLFTEQAYLEAFDEAGLDTVHDPEGLTNRGLYIGVKPASEK